MQDERDREEPSIQYAVRFHEGGGEHTDMQRLEDREEEKSIFDKDKLQDWSTAQPRFTRESRMCVTRPEKEQARTGGR